MEKGVLGIAQFQHPVNLIPMGHRMKQERKNQYQLRKNIIPNSPTIGAPGTMRLRAEWLVNPDGGLVVNAHRTGLSERGNDYS